MGEHRTVKRVLIMLAAMLITLGLIPSSSALAADGGKAPGGKGDTRTAEIALRPVQSGEVGVQDIIICTVTLDGWYAGSGSNLAEGIVICPTIENSITMTFVWYKSGASTPSRTAPKPACVNKSTCVKTDGYSSYSTLYVYMCATMVKAGYTTSSVCLVDGPF